MATAIVKNRSGRANTAIVLYVSILVSTASHADAGTVGHHVSITSASRQQRPARSRPNLVMLFVDDMGYGDVGFTGHPTTKTNNINKLAYGGKVLSTWYSGCPVCSGSRAALMTGRQFARLGVPGVFFMDEKVGLPLNETLIAGQLKKAQYATMAVGKWHLGQRPMFLPAARGFDRYLGIPYSADMGDARATPCAPGQPERTLRGTYPRGPGADPAGDFLPLIEQHQQPGMEHANTTVLEQPLDFSTLGAKYNAAILDFVAEQQHSPFFLYVPFSHVHAARPNQPQEQYAGCAFHNVSNRGLFGDALAEVDWIVGNLVAKLEELELMENTAIFLAGDNGPDMFKQQSGGCEGLFTGRAAGYWNTGKGSTWEGGIRQSAFAHWRGQIEPASRSDEIVSSLDIFPTFSALAGVALPAGVVYDGRDMSEVLFKPEGRSQHDVLFIYGVNEVAGDGGPAAARMGRYKAHWITEPGLGGCSALLPLCPTTGKPACQLRCNLPTDMPLLFNVAADPSEAYPLFGVANTSMGDGTAPLDPTSFFDSDEIKQVVATLVAARKREMSSFPNATLVAPPDLPGEGEGRYGVCCNRDPWVAGSGGPNASCDCSGEPHE